LEIDATSIQSPISNLWLAMKYEYYAIIPHVNEPRVLLLPGEMGWTLPRWESTERTFWQVVGQVNQALGVRLGIEVTTQRCMGIVDREDAEGWSRELVYAVENHSPAWVPPDGGRWVGRDELEGLKLAMPAHRAQLRRWFADAADTPPNRPPWYQPGWFDTVRAWVDEQLARHGLVAVGPLEQLRSWERSAVLRIRTDGGIVYFKAAPAMFAHEPPLTRALAEYDPAHFPRVLAVDLERRWMLMPASGDQTLDKVSDITRWEQAARQFACVQIELSGQVNRLVALGCPRRRLSDLAGWTAALLDDTPALLSGQPGGLAPDDIAALRARTPELAALCAELAGYRVPETLEHGDLWPGQIVVHDDSFVFIDWSDSSIAHPFFSMNLFTESSEGAEFWPSDADRRVRLRDAYLEPWTAYEPMERLVAAFELAQAVAPLHYAALYHRSVLPAMENRWEMERLVPFYLRKLLRATA
jgi:hypothetical protein